jgi:GT2 family glycosyltransferase
MSQEETELSIIIVNYNGKEYLKNCLESISKCCTVSHEVILVDNASTDGSQSFLKKNHPEVVLIENTTNTGFARANNLGVEKSTGKNILLLNNDTILLDSIDPLLKEITHENIGAITIKMLNGDKQFIAPYGKFPTPMNLIKLANLNEKREELRSGDFCKEKYKVDWITGSFLLIKRKDWDLVNGLDEDYFMYVEDVDFSKKLQKQGKEILFYANYSYIHFVGFNPKREIKLIEGYKIYAKKHFSVLGNIMAQLMLSFNLFIKKYIKKTL